MKTSIAMTTYNGKKNIRDLLDSIRMQELLPDEVIIVDDCSTDGTYEYVNEYIQFYDLGNWFNYRNSSNIGWKRNFRKALNKCTGDLIFLCDQDDIWEKKKIIEMTSVMNNDQRISLLVSNYKVLNEDREEAVNIRGLNKDNGTIEHLPFNFTGLTVRRPGCTYCARKELVRTMIANDLIDAPHDAMLWGYAMLYETLYLYNRKMITFRRHSDSASAPKTSISIQRRVGEIETEISIKEFFKNVCKSENLNNKEKMISEQIRFLEKRVEHLKEKGIIRNVIFQLIHFKHYATLRNLLSDDFIIIHRDK